MAITMPEFFATAKIRVHVTFISLNSD